ncbi:hypothetical protein FQN57_000254 [Myotisia sp. PD_48]|nr:hypothetical protein FQN57_000254 [Myotisia sp. PD_48]
MVVSLSNAYFQSDEVDHVTSLLRHVNEDDERAQQTLNDSNQPANTTTPMIMQLDPNSSTMSPGILPIATTSEQKSTTNPSSKPSSSRANAPRLKVHVRRLPPGITQDEFESVLGDDWKVGNGKIDWFAFKQGKVSTDLSKPSRPARAYFRTTSQSYISELADLVRQSSFHDVRNSFNDPALLGPPSLEFAPFPRVPSGRVRPDARLGTIDQEPEFITFLQNLTNPPTKDTEEETEEPEKDEKPHITPLIQYLREKKAHKAKEKEASIAAKQSKQARATSGTAAKDKRGEKVQSKKLLSRAERASSEKQSRERATRDAVKAASKEASKNSAPRSKPKPAADSNNATAASTPSSSAPERKRERGSLAAATKILRRDLGLAPASAARRKPDKADTQQAASGPSTPKTPENNRKDLPISPVAGGSNQSPIPKGKNLPLRTTPRASSGKQLRGTPPTEPAAARNALSKSPSTPPTGPSAGAKSPATPGSRQLPQPTQTAPITQAFLKHANPSQGVTEDLLNSGFSQFGQVLRVEIDKKKGFGYVDFAEPEALRKAIAASPVQIAQSQVVVLERRTTAAVSQARTSSRGHAPARGPGQAPQNRPPPPTGPGGSRGTPQGPRGGGGGGSGGRGSRRGGFGRGAARGK